MHRPSASIDAVRGRLQIELASALRRYAARYDIPFEPAFAALQDVPPHLLLRPEISLEFGNSFIRDCGERHGIPTFDDDAKAILHAAYTQGGVHSAKLRNLGKLDRRKAHWRAKRFFASEPRGRRSTINTAIADHLKDVLEQLAGRAVRASRYPPESKSLDGEPLDGKPHGLLFEILLQSRSGKFIKLDKSFLA